MSGKLATITTGKGGAGMTTIAANSSVTLAHRDPIVACIDDDK